MLGDPRCPGSFQERARGQTDTPMALIRLSPGCKILQVQTAPGALHGFLSDALAASGAKVLRWGLLQMTLHS